MRDLEEKFVESDVIYRGKLLNLRRDKVRLPDGRLTYREIVEHSGAVGIIPLTAEDEVILVQQYRAPAGKLLWEVPAGKLEEGEDPLDCAARELEEETGYRAAKFTPLAGFYTSPGFADEYLHLYLAEELEFVGENSDEDEFLRVKKFPLARVPQLIKSRILEDAKTLVGLSLLLYRRDL